MEYWPHNVCSKNVYRVIFVSILGEKSVVLEKISAGAVRNLN